MLDTGYWILDTGCWILDTGCWMLDGGCWMVDKESVASHKYVKKVKLDSYTIVDSLSIKNSKHQKTNNKQYPSSNDPNRF
jgi:hypothetical protein